MAGGLKLWGTGYLVQNPAFKQFGDTLFQFEKFVFFFIAYFIISHKMFNKDIFFSQLKKTKISGYLSNYVPTSDFREFSQ